MDAFLDMLPEASFGRPDGLTFETVEEGGKPSVVIGEGAVAAREARERRRGDRMIGLARWQFDRVHRGMAYDLELETSRATAMECAEAIKARFAL